MGKNFNELNRDICNMSFISIDSLWNTYGMDSKLVKVLANDDLMLQKRMKLVLKQLMMQDKSMPTVASIENLYFENGNFRAYSKEILPGKNLFEIDFQTLVSVYPDVMDSLIDTIDSASRKQVFFLDLFQKNNVCYDFITKRANINSVENIQVDSLRHDMFTNTMKHLELLQYILKTDKYYEGNRYTKEINVLVLYELFFRSLFKCSLLENSFLPMLLKLQLTHHKNVLPSHLNKMSLCLENSLCEFLNELGFSKKDDIYAKILDLGKSRSNSIHSQDFIDLSLKYDVVEDKKRVRLRCK